jgi:NB-ARC domain
VLSGAGGFGKSTLAIDIMNAPEIQDACFDGILWWVELHEELVKIDKGPRGTEALREAIKARIESLIRDMTGAGGVLDDLDRTKDRLSQLLAHKRVLLVIDDAWDMSHAKHFIEAAPHAPALRAGPSRESGFVLRPRATILGSSSGSASFQPLSNGNPAS